jgi:hypothetical protein
MTGREQRVLSGYSALAARKTTEPEDGETVNLTAKAKDQLQLNKLAYNLDALVDYCEHVSRINSNPSSHFLLTCILILSLLRKSFKMLKSCHAIKIK